MKKDLFLSELVRASQSIKELRLFMGKCGNFSLMLKPVMFSKHEIATNSDQVIKHIFSQDSLPLDQCCEIYEEMLRDFRIAKYSYSKELQEAVNLYRDIMKLEIPSIQTRRMILHQITSYDPRIDWERASAINKAKRWERAVEIIDTTSFAHQHISLWRETASKLAILERAKAQEEQEKIEERQRLEKERRRLEGQIEEERRRLEGQSQEGKLRSFKKITIYFEAKKYKLLTDHEQFLKATPIFGVYLDSYYSKSSYGDDHKSKGDTKLILDFKRGYPNGIMKYKSQIESFIEDVLSYSLEKKIRYDEVCLVAVPSSTKGPASETNPFRQIFRSNTRLLDLDFSSRVIRSEQTFNHIDRPKKLGRNYFASEHKETLEVKEPEYFRDKYILIFDDIYTSGATMNAVIGKLCISEPKAIFFLTVGRTISGHDRSII